MSSTAKKMFGTLGFYILSLTLEFVDASSCYYFIEQYGYSDSTFCRDGCCNSDTYTPCCNDSDNGWPYSYNISAGAIIGIVIGSILGLSVFITIIICICDNRTNKRNYCGNVITSSPTIAYVSASNTCNIQPLGRNVDTEFMTCSTELAYTTSNSSTQPSLYSTCNTSLPPPYNIGDTSTLPPPYDVSGASALSPPNNTGDTSTLPPPYDVSDTSALPPPNSTDNTSTLPPPYDTGDASELPPLYNIVVNNTSIQERPAHRIPCQADSTPKTATYSNSTSCTECNEHVYSVLSES